MLFDPSKKDEAGKQTKKIMKTLGNSNFLNALKIGYLYKRSESFFRSWTEKFCVLTNVGLLYYDDPNKRPRNLFPIIDSTIKPIPADKYSRDFVFCIVSFSLEIEFAAQSKEDYDSWMRAFKKLQQEFDKKRETQLSSFE